MEYATKIYTSANNRSKSSLSYKAELYLVLRQRGSLVALQSTSHKACLVNTLTRTVSYSSFINKTPREEVISSGVYSKGIRLGYNIVCQKAQADPRVDPTKTPF